MRALHGLDRPFTERYLAWAAGLLRGEFGYSRLFAQPVAALLGPALLSTLALAGTALAIALVAGVALGALAASRPRAAPLVDAIAVMGQAMPTFWLGILLIIAFAVTLGWLPAGGARGGRARPGLPGAAGGDARHRASRRLCAPLGGEPRSHAHRALDPHRPRARRVGAPRAVAPRLPQCRAAGAADRRTRCRRPGRWRAGDGNRVCPPRHGQAAVRRGDGQRHQPGPGRAAAGGGGDDVRDARRQTSRNARSTPGCAKR